MAIQQELNVSEMESEVKKIETDKAIELAIRIVDDRIRTVTRSRWGKKFRGRDAPHWLHRTITKEQLTPPDPLVGYSVRVKGLYHVHKLKKIIHFDCDMIVKIEIRNDIELYFVEAEGGVWPRDE